ncbi:Hypothetical predicted protein [Mytilus galloprovincialis]|uniref:Mab-21-like HhH/H2TH-like domain-containing protein n=1 Tax=Mytilus galloprovincialis TaxID=29158 RepID=A0A8B6GI98_MYTGA|nr:Hypothetical predicted protein [Mytilus galloprovincialis]
MSQTDRELSLKIYQFLCNIVGTEEVVQTRRKRFCAFDSVLRILNFTVISSGSKAEGLDLNGSDYDQMCIYHLVKVYENKETVSSSEKNTPIVMDISDTKPGFTKLKLYEQRHMYHINQWRESVNGETYISSKLFREHELPGNMIIHGPCQSLPGDYYDMARCLRCEEWITPAHQWVFRSRSTWPDHRLVMSVIKEGVLFVPIGCKGSLNEDLEWRISFSMAEKQLIFSFSHTQLLCYALLKIILKDIIKGKHGDLICSYFLKTILFWVFEESRPSDWHPDENNFKASNNLVYEQYQIRLKFFKAGLYSDAISAWSLLASLFYKQKRFHECIDIINYTLSKCTLDKIVLPCNSLPVQTYFKKVKEAVGLLLTCKHLIIGEVLFTKPYYLLPVELFPLIQKGFAKCVCIIPAVVFLNMLSFLCVYHSGDNRGKLNALRDLELIIRERYFILPCYKEKVIHCFQIAKSMM